MQNSVPLFSTLPNCEKGGKVCAQNVQMYKNHRKPPHTVDIRDGT